MPLAAKLDRKLRAAEESSDGEDYYEVTDRSSSESVLETGAGGEIVSSGDEALSDASNDDDQRVKAQVSNDSFGALAKANDALSKQRSADGKRKRGEDTSQSQQDKLEALRERLRQIKAEKMANGAKPGKTDDGAKKRKVIQEESSEDDDDDNSDADSDDSEPDAAPKARSSKHAPMVQSSKRMVSRKRKVVQVKKPVFRDPRFDSMGAAPDEHTLGSRYAFLNDYRASEMAELRRSIKKSKNEGEKERLKKQLLSMESQQKARENKEKQQHVIREHRKKEKELVKQGKQPFFLKKSEQKKLALVDRFQKMKSKQRDKVIERRRKKVAAKERRNMPERRAG
ncbi:rRNA biogenesis protein rrp36 [Pleosporales sp. CAS-2024a]